MGTPSRCHTTAVASYRRLPTASATSCRRRLHCPPHARAPGSRRLVPADVDCAEYARRGIASTGRWSIEAVLHLSPAEARRRLTRIHADLDPHPDGVTLRTRVDDLDALARFLVGVGCAFQVRQPTELSTALRCLAAEIARMSQV